MQAKRIYNVAFLGSNEKGSLPVFTRIEAVTAKRAQKRFIEEFRPVKGWFLGDPEDVTEQAQHEAEAVTRQQQA
ncbi:hypothetical protein P4910_23590 [Pantoea stewartii]|uniref:hypothetical protein n=1 Tax=Pantoea stewartii TaxID=66269 RepID=UPI0023F9D88C|nr:hypothetical protein [Pantoea stewartii]MDF7788434.1 hypothetical protein [Pantoea stewartii]